MRQDARLNQEKIIAAAWELFQANPTTPLQMTSVAKAAGVGVGTLYRNYPNLAALSIAMVEDDLAGFLAGVEPKLTPLTGPARLRQFLADYLVYREHVRPLLALIESNLKQEQAFMQTPLYRQLCDLVATCLPPELGAEQREFNARSLVALLRSNLYRYQREEAGRSVEQVQELVLGLFWP